MRILLIYITLSQFLLIQFNVAIDMHLCRGTVVDYKVWGDAERCGHHDEVKENDCLNHSLKKDGCCSDFSVVLETESTFYKKAEVNQDEDDSSFYQVEMFVEVNKYLSCSLLPIFLYDPPPNIVDIPVFIQSFLI